MPQAHDVIRSARNPLVQRFRRLAKSAAAEPDAALVEGPKLLSEALRCRAEIIEVAATAAALRTSEDWVAQIPAARTRLVSERVLQSVSALRSSRGVVAIVTRPRYEWNEIFGANPLVLVADSVQEPGNLGGLIRTAAAAGATGAVLAGACADPFSWRALRGSMGGAFRLPHVRVESALGVLSRLRERGVRLVAAVPHAEMDHLETDWREPSALVVGSEGSGLSPDVIPSVDAIVSIQMQSGAASLNVGVAAGVMLFEAARQRRGPALGSTHGP